jgi:ABC-type amino acid transport substrate-binding protein
MGVAILVCALAGSGARTLLARAAASGSARADVVGAMHAALHQGPATVHRNAPGASAASPASGVAPASARRVLPASALERIARSGILRVGYHPDNLPFSFFNGEDELVGYDVDMAHLLARHLGCALEFQPFEFETLAGQLDRGEFDVAMSGVAMTPPRLATMRFSVPYTDATAALLVRDHRRREFRRRIVDQDFDGVRIAVARKVGLSSLLAQTLPGAEIVQVGSPREYLESGEAAADAMVWVAEGGSAWTLLYPSYSVVVIRPVFKAAAGYAVASGDEAFAEFLSGWIEFIRRTFLDERLYDHWILGKSAERREARWSVIRDLLHWVD